MADELENKNQQAQSEQSQGTREGSPRPAQGQTRDYNPATGRTPRPRIHSQQSYSADRVSGPRSGGGFRPEGFGTALGGDSQRGYQRRTGGYQPRPRYNGNGGGGSYQPRPRYNNGEGGYQPRPRYNNNGEGGYQPRPRYNNNGEGGYQPRPRYNNNGEGGYQPRPRYNNNGEGGYQPRPRYNNNGEGGYKPRPRYNNNNGEGGYQPRPRYNNGGGYQQRSGYGRQQGGYQQRGSYDPRYSSFKKRVDYKETHTDPDEEIRLNKYLANAGVCSRREADEYIQQGAVTVNGEVVKELGTKVKRSDEVKFNGQPVTLEKKVYVLLNKPKDYVTTSDDPQQRKTVMDLVKDACPERIYPVGRLDRNTTGVLLLTNDGELASKLTHPKFLKKKVYHVFLDRNVSAEDMQQLADGVELEDGEAHADTVEYADESDHSQVGVEIHSGRNRIVRRLFEHLGYRVVKLDRVQFCGLTKKGLRRGDWRFLTQQEVETLQSGLFE